MHPGVCIFPLACCRLLIYASFSMCVILELCEAFPNRCLWLFGCEYLFLYFSAEVFATLLTPSTQYEFCNVEICISVAITGSC